MAPWLARISIYPVKSLDGEGAHDARVVGVGKLEHDREFRFVDESGDVLNGKALGEKVIGIRTGFDFAFSELTARDNGSTLRVRLPAGKAEAEAWFSERFGVPALLEQDASRGFPDDTVASGPTLISRATLETVAGWFGLDVDEARRRFRANLEIEGVPAFWEDRLFGADGARPFSIGDVQLEGVNPCARCAVPTRDSRSGEPGPPGFAKILGDRRKQSLPEWAAASRFDHYYRLALNTRIPESENGKLLTLGDEVRL